MIVSACVYDFDRLLTMCLEENGKLTDLLRHRRRVLVYQGWVMRIVSHFTH